MKHIVYIAIVSLFLFSCTEKELDFSQLQERDDIYYEVNQDKPFTGIAFTKYENEQFSRRFGFKNGIKHGLSETWHENGQLWTTENYSKGIATGAYARYNEQGAVMEEGTISNNSFTHTEYQDDGQLEEELFVKGDFTTLHLGSFKYNRDSVQKYEQKYYDRSGHMYSHYFFEDGSGFEKSIFENGEIQYERNYVNGKPSGTWTTYSREGNVKEIVSYNDNGELHGMSVKYNSNYPTDTTSYIVYSNGEKLDEAFYHQKKDGSCIKRLASYMDGGVVGDWQFWNKDCSKRPHLSELAGKWKMVTTSMTYSYLNLYANGTFTTESKNLSGYANNGNGAYQAYYDAEKGEQVFHRLTYYTRKNQKALYQISYFTEDKLYLSSLTSGYSSLEYERVE